MPYSWTYQRPLTDEPRFIDYQIKVYGFQKDALSFRKSYLTKRQQRVRVNSKFNT